MAEQEKCPTCGGERGKPKRLHPVAFIVKAFNPTAQGYDHGEWHDFIKETATTYGCDNYTAAGRVTPCQLCPSIFHILPQTKQQEVAAVSQEVPMTPNAEKCPTCGGERGNPKQLHECSFHFGGTTGLAEFGEDDACSGGTDYCEWCINPFHTAPQAKPPEPSPISAETMEAAIAAMDRLHEEFKELLTERGLDTSTPCLCTIGIGTASEIIAPFIQSLVDKETAELQKDLSVTKAMIRFYVKSEEVKKAERDTLREQNRLQGERIGELEHLKNQISTLHDVALGQVKSAVERAESAEAKLKECVGMLEYQLEILSPLHHHGLSMWYSMQVGSDQVDRWRQAIAAAKEQS